MAQALPDPVRDACRRAFLAGDRWAPRETQAPRVERVLGSGLSNTALLLAGARERWVLRVPLAPPGPGVHRAREYALHALAARADLAPPILFFEAGTGVMITPFLEAGERAPGIDAIAALLRGIHRLPVPAPQGEEGDAHATLDSAVRLRAWRDHLGERDPLRMLSRAALEAIGAAVERIDATEIEPRVCHNDLLAANRLNGSDGRLRAIDWEYASPGDPLFDLAGVASELADGDRGPLLRTYLERPPTPAEEQRFRDQQILYLAIAACWHAAADTGAAGRDEAVAALARACTASAP